MTVPFTVVYFSRDRFEYEQLADGLQTLSASSVESNMNKISNATCSAAALQRPWKVENMLNIQEARFMAVFSP